VLFLDYFTLFSSSFSAVFWCDFSFFSLVIVFAPFFPSIHHHTVTNSRADKPLAFYLIFLDRPGRTSPLDEECRGGVYDQCGFPGL
jgi:hypothetical protein